MIKKLSIFTVLAILAFFVFSDDGVSQVKERKADPAGYFSSNKNDILKRIDSYIVQGKYQAAWNMFETYSAANDHDLNALKNKLSKSWEQKILQDLRSIPGSKYKENMDLYKTLIDLNPSVKKYQDKFKYYETRYKIEKSLYGEKPTSYVVSNHLRNITKFPSSVNVHWCKDAIKGDQGWMLSCKYSAKNSFDQTVTTFSGFVIRNNSVVSTFK